MLELIEDLKHKFRDDRDAISRELQGTTIMTRYNKTLYRIDAIAWDKSPNSTFLRRDRKSGEENQITYTSYYQQRYNAKVQYMNQPLLLFKDR